MPGHSFFRTLVTAGVAASAMLTACTTTGGANGSGESLVAAGFVKRLANTAERQAMLDRLPPNRFLKRERGRTVHYVYADPKGCDCLYVGSQQAWDSYRLAKRRAAVASHLPVYARSHHDGGWDWGVVGSMDSQFRRSVRAGKRVVTGPLLWRNQAVGWTAATNLNAESLKFTIPHFPATTADGSNTP